MRNATVFLPIVVSLVMAAAACGGSPEPGGPATATPAETASAPARAPGAGSLYGAPAPSDSKGREIDDLSRDLQNVGQQKPSGVSEFTSDLATLVPNPPEKSQLDAFGRSIVAAVQGLSLEPAKGRQLAELVYAALYTNQLTAADRARVKNQLSAALREAGAPADRVAAVETAFDRLTPGAR